MSARIGVAVLAIALVGALTLTGSSQPSRPVSNSAIDRGLSIETGQATRKLHEQMLSGGVLSSAWQARIPARAVSGPGPSAPEGVRIRTLGCPKVFSGEFNNIKVNQDCSFRVHAEEIIVVDPADPAHLVAAQNDRRLGVNHCSIAFSFDQGKHWGDLTPPLWEFIAPDAHKYDHASDPALAMDSRGNTYFTCVIFQDIAPASGILVTKSNAQFGGAFFHSPVSNPSPGPQHFVTLPLGVVANDNTPLVFNDKEFIFSDPNATSAKRDNVYVTWTRFRMGCPTANDFCESPIFFSQSTDGGATWSKGLEISGASAACVGGNSFDPTLDATRCNFDQGSWLVVGRDGTLYVTFNNSNTPGLPAQQMIVKCLVGSNCSLAASWTAPVKIVDDQDTQPFGPNAVSGCTAGRQCLPPNGYRLNDFGNAALDPQFGSHGRLFFAWADFRNGGPCAGTPLHPVAPCDNYNNDVFVVWSDDGGATWSPRKLASGGAGTGAAQWQPWLTVGPDGTVYIAYYDRQYGSCDTTGCNDITLATSRDHGQTFQRTRITTQSMPNLTAVTTPTQSGFLGDYMSVAANQQGAYIVWADTRPHAGTIPVENIFFAFFPKDKVPTK